MKKLLKFLGYFILTVLLLCVILFVTASLSQKKIVDIALKKINESTNVPIEIEDLSFTFIKRFPFATIELSGVKIGTVDSIGTNTQSQPDEDILNIESVFVSVKTIPLFKGEFEIIKVEIDDATLNYNVDSMGVSNIYALLNMNAKDSSGTDTSASIPAIDLNKVKLKRTSVFYNDEKNRAKATLFFSSLDLEGKFADENFNGTIKGDLKLTKCGYSTTKLDQLEEAVFDFKLDYIADTLKIKSLEANSDGVQLLISGKASFTENVFTDLAFESDKLELGKLLKYAPDELLKEYGIANIDGILNLSGTAKGIVSDSVLPAVDIVFALKNGFVKTEDYPAIKKVDFAGNISNGSERNNKTTNLIFNSFHAETDSSSVDLSLSLKNIDKPEYTLNSKLNINIEEFKKFIPDTIIRNISGKITGELSTKGQLPDSVDDNFINYAAYNSSANIEFKKFNLELDSISVKEFSGSIVYKPGQLVVNNLNGKVPVYKLSLNNTSFDAEVTGSFMQPQNLEIKFNSFYAEAAPGTVSGSAKIENLKHPEFVINANALVNLAEIKPFIPDTLVKDLTGTLKTEISSHGKLNLDSISEQFYDIILNKSILNFEAKDISVTMPDTLQKLSKFNGFLKVEQDRMTFSKLKGIAADIDFSIDNATIANVYNAINKNQKDTISISKMKGVKDEMDFSIEAATIVNAYNALIMNQNNTISISKMTGVVAGTDFSIDSATIVNVYNAVIMNQKETVSIFGIFEFGAIDYSILVPFFNNLSSEETLKQNTKSELATNQNVIKENKSDNSPKNFLFEFKGKIKAKSFKYQKIQLEDISAKFNFTDSVYIIDQLKVNAFDGTSNSSVRFSIIGNGRQILNLKNHVSRIDINKFMYAFDNFGYDSLISYENIKGLVSADLNSRIAFNADTLVTEDIRVKGDLTLENGRIINYQPAMDVANFTGIKELDNIELKTLKSNLFIFKNQMYVPATDVVSSSMDFSVFGMQSFGDNYEYHLQMHLGDVLKGKSKKLYERQSASGDEVSTEDMDRSTIKIIYANIDGKAKAGFDTKKAQKAMELKIQVQQKMLDLIFYPKLVSFETGVK